MRDINLEITGWEEGPDSLTTSWRFSAILDLPWKPRLAAAGGTTHVFSKVRGGGCRQGLSAGWAPAALATMHTVPASDPGMELPCLVPDTTAAAAAAAALQATGRVSEHIERWEVEPGAVVRSLLKPSSKFPQSEWDVLMGSLYEGDAKGVWLALSPGVLKGSALLSAASLLASVAAPGGLPPGAVPLGALAYGGLAAALVTEVSKLVKGMGGGESG